VNTYRLLRTSIEEEEANVFLPDDAGNGEYRAALLLLGILVGFPNQASRVFRLLVETDASNWSGFLQRLGEEPEEGLGSPGEEEPTANRPDDVTWERFMEALKDAAARATPAQDLDVFRYWARRVARYSFQTGRLVIALPEDDEVPGASFKPRATPPR
jgi:hypothetical protein